MNTGRYFVISPGEELAVAPVEHASYSQLWVVIQESGMIEAGNKPLQAALGLSSVRGFVVAARRLCSIY